MIVHCELVHNAMLVARLCTFWFNTSTAAAVGRSLQVAAGLDSAVAAAVCNPFSVQSWLLICCWVVAL